MIDGDAGSTMAVESPERVHAMPLPADVASLAASAGVDDILVFRRSDETFDLLGGAGRGAGWAGIVSVDFRADSAVARAWRTGTPIRQADRRPHQVAGPYHARHAVAIPVGERFVVVFGSGRPIGQRDAELVRYAVGAVDRVHGVPADKLLADELELVHAVRRLMAYRPENVRDTLRHVATVAAESLSCEVALIRVGDEAGPITEAIRLDRDEAAIGPAADRLLGSSDAATPMAVDQSIDPEVGAEVFGVDVASQMVLRLGDDPPIGAMALGHALARPRGFTNLCQRIGLAIAEAAELLVTQAMARERLAAERDLLARMSGTDPLTGVANRRAFDQAVAKLTNGADGESVVIVSGDLDGLKATNDRFGHAAGDQLLVAAANLLNSCVRSTDLVARVGGDEFAVLLRGADTRTAARIVARIRRAERVWRVTEHGLVPRISLGTAPVIDGDIEAARRLADRRMYANKRRRADVVVETRPAARSDRSRATDRLSA